MQGLSTELGAFIAGVMLSSTDQQELCLHNLESIKHFFLTLFISSMGLVMSPVFLLQHLPVLAGGVLMCVICKSILVRHSSQLSLVQRHYGMAMGGPPPEGLGCTSTTPCVLTCQASLSGSLPEAGQEGQRQRWKIQQQQWLQGLGGACTPGSSQQVT